MDRLNEQVADTLRDIGFSVIPDKATDAMERADLLVRLPTAGEEAVAMVDVTHRATLSPVEMEKWRDQHPGGTILGCRYVSSLFAQRLQAAGIDYVDTAGNAHIRRPGLLVQIDGRRLAKHSSPPPVGHHPPPPGPASLRVIFVLLVKPDLAGSTFDELTAVSGVAKGTVHNVMRDLAVRGHLTGHRRDRRLVDRPELVELWVDGFAGQLLPRLGQEALAGPDPQWWMEHAPTGTDIVLGGGVALAHYGGPLRPYTTTIYGPRPWAAARKLGRLTSHGHHNVILRERFWSPELLPEARFVHPLLAYAEALAGGDSREIEVARTLSAPGLLTR